MIRLVVHMHERPLHVGQNLDLVLQLLADVVRLPQGRVCVHDHVDFNEVVWAALRSSRRQRGGTSMGFKLTWYARTVSILSISSLNVIAL